MIADSPLDLPFIRGLVDAGNDELMEEVGPILATIHSMRPEHPDHGPLVRQARALLQQEWAAGDAELVLEALWAGYEYAKTKEAL